MSTGTIDTLQIEIEASSNNASKQIDDLTGALRRLKNQADKGTGLEKIKSDLDGIGTRANKATRAFAAIKSGLKLISFRQVVNYLGDAVTSINDYVENLNLFQVSMGRFYKDAYAYAMLVNDRLGVDPSAWMRTQGVFMSMGKGFGMAEKQAYDLSESLTELSYDIGSLYNEDVERASLRLQSALAGEIEPIRRLGISISQATLQEYALSKGIDKSVASMTEQEKALLRSLKLIEGASDIGAIGDFARTLESPANALRVFNQQIEQMKRAIGSVLLPIIVQVLPYMQAFVSLLTDAISGLATLLGLEMPSWDNSAWDNAYSGAADAVDDTTDAVKKLKNATIGLDELNIINPNAGGSAGAGGLSGWAENLEIPDLWDKNAISQIESRANALKEKLEPIFDIVTKIAAAFLLFKIGQGIFDGLANLGNRINGIKKDVENLKTGLAIISVVAGIALSIDNISAILSGEYENTSLESAVKTAISGLLIGAAGFIKFGSLLAIPIAVVGMFQLTDVIVNVDHYKTMGKEAFSAVTNLLRGDLNAALTDLEEFAVADMTRDSWGVKISQGLVDAVVGEGTWNRWIEQIENGGFVKAKDYLENAVHEIWLSIKSDAIYQWGLVSEAWNGFWGKLTSFVTETVPNWFENDVKPWFTIEKWKEIGKNAIDGLFNGLAGYGNSVKTWGSDFIQKIKDRLGIHSPSTEFEAIGEYSVAGMQRGFRGLYVITDMFGNQLGIMMSYASNFSDEIHIMIDSGLSDYLYALMEAKNNTQKTTDSMTAMFRTMAANSNAAIYSIISSLNAIPRNVTTVHTVVTRTVSESAGSSVKAFASGGFPDHGQMFIARESGPELVGTIGNRTAVANNDQIVAAIEEAAYRGFLRAASDGGGNAAPVVVENKVYLDGKQMRASFKKAERESGATISSGGVLTR